MAIAVAVSRNAATNKYNQCQNYTGVRGHTRASTRHKKIRRIFFEAIGGHH